MVTKMNNNVRSVMNKRHFKVYNGIICEQILRYTITFFIAVGASKRRSNVFIVLQQ